MSHGQYEYEYHDIAEDADYIDQDDDIYYNDGSYEPWMGLDSDETQSIDDNDLWDNYYHNIADELTEE